jgi:hypothetical protein
MTYASGGLISATDYNALVGSNSTTAGTLNYVWNTGNGAFGYGQGAISVVSASGTVTATSWSTMLNALNRCLQHQSGAGATLGPVNYTAGGTITYFANVSTSVTTINTNKALATAQGSTTTGSNFAPVVSAATAVAYGPTVFATRSVTFASGDAARYFFNAGGQLNLVISSVTGNGTGRSNDAITLLATNIGGITAFKNVTNGGRTGTGGTVNTNTTSTGYRGLSTSAVTIQQITSATGAYTSDYAYVQVYSSAQNASGNGDLGATVYFNIGLYSPGHLINAALSVTVNHRVDIVYPETTYLNGAAPWGTPTVA